ncbi:hypothetical protein V9T40_013156 [Parthenolecanium corni]|uniref:Uncharacterized protein n=1 Tax=Parthenolecanium corni TaxID=536013 RepID=A0AAN9TN10_9HEMI
MSLKYLRVASTVDTTADGKREDKGERKRGRRHSARRPNVLYLEKRRAELPRHLADYLPFGWVSQIHIFRSFGAPVSLASRNTYRTAIPITFAVGSLISVFCYFGAAEPPPAHGTFDVGRAKTRAFAVHDRVAAGNWRLESVRLVRGAGVWRSERKSDDSAGGWLGDVEREMRARNSSNRRDATHGGA